MMDNEEEHLTDWIVTNRLSQGYEEGEYGDEDEDDRDFHDDELYGRVS